MDISARDFDDEVLVFLFSFRDMLFNNEVVAVTRPDGQIGWMPAPQWDETPYICPFCGGSGFLTPAQAQLIGSDFRLDNLCPECHGTGIADSGQPLEDDALPDTDFGTQPLPGRDALDGAS